MLESIEVEDRRIGKGEMPYMVAELSGNHQKSITSAKKLIEAAAKAGAHGVKLQTYTPDTLTLPIRNDYFLKKAGLWKDKYLYELYQEGMTPWEWFPELKAFANELGVTFFSTPFDDSAVEFLEKEVDPPLYKIASYELNHLPLLKEVARTNKPVVLSTGMGTEVEIERAVETLRSHGKGPMVLVKCISSYPADPKDFNLRAIPSMEERFGCLVGLSDHTLSHEVALGAVALGACFIEKHIILKRENDAIDKGFSLEPEEFAEMVHQVGILYKALGSNKIGPAHQEALERTQRRSIFASRDISAGERLTEDNLRIVRPGHGLCPSCWEEILGKELTAGLKAGEPLVEGCWR